MEKTNQNIEQNTNMEQEVNIEQNANSDIDYNVEQNEETKKKFSPAVLIMPGIIAIILAVFAGVVYYGKVVKPKKDIDKQAGYKVEDYITLDKYTGFDYEVTQDVFDECVKEETDSYEEVERAAIATDQIEFNYTGYIDGSKIADISQKDAELIVGEDTKGAYKVFSEAIIGKKAGSRFEVEVNGADVNEISLSQQNYTNKKVIFKIKINSVSKLDVEKITDKWVKENYLEDYGLENTKDFYQWCKDYIMDDAKVEVWQKAVDSATMAGYPQEVYDDIVVEFTQNANYYAEQFGITTDQYLKDFCGYTDETLEEEYLNEVKSELVMWYIVKEQRLECTEEDIEAKYEELYLDLGYDNVEGMKADYKKKEMKKAVLLDKAQDYVYDNSNIKENFEVPKN